MKDLKKIKILLTVFSVFLIGQMMFAQEKKSIEKANELYSNYSYVEATKVYEKIADKGFVNQDILQKLGNSYFFRADYLNALKWYDMLFQKVNSGEYKKVEPEYYYRYAQCLKSDERYDESNQVMDKFVELTHDKNEIAYLYNKNRDYLAEIKKNSGRMEIAPTAINTEYSEYGPAFYTNKNIVFTANRSPGFFGRVSEWTNAGMYNIYIAERSTDSITKDSIFGETKINGNINTKLNESTATFTKDGKTVYFTRNKPFKKLERKDKTKDVTILLKLYKAEKDNWGNWINIKELPFSSDAYSVAHPALSPDEKYLYFASDMPGTYGDSDIFRVEIKEDGTFGKPENLGENINTNARESFPFVTSENVLYFASDGFPGLGGLDIFAAQINENNELGQPQNIGRPVNSPYDDFSLIFDPESNIGYFSSNRPGGKGSDDIYRFNEKKPLVLKCTKVIKGIVKDETTGEIIDSVSVNLSNRAYEEKAVALSNDKGSFRFDDGLIFCEDSYCYLRASKEGYEAKEEKVTFEDNQDKDIFKEILLTPAKQKIDTGTDLAKVFKIDDIYFDFDKSDIRPDAEVQLSQIVEVMREYPEMKIEVKSHTDSRGSASYNRALSDRRAKSTVRWIISQGISSDRISGEGYGEDMLVNGCSDGVDCTEEEHQANRRSEFIIIQMKNGEVNED